MYLKKSHSPNSTQNFSSVLLDFHITHPISRGGNLLPSNSLCLQSSPFDRKAVTKVGLLVGELGLATSFVQALQQGPGRWVASWLGWLGKGGNGGGLAPCGCLFGVFFHFFWRENELKGNKNTTMNYQKKTQNLSENGWMFFLVEVGMIGRR